MKNITENDINRLVNKILKEDEDINMETLRKAVDDYKQKHTPEISKKTGEPVKKGELPFKGYYNISDNDVPLNVRSFYNDFKKKLTVFNLKPSKLSKSEILDVLDKILTLNGFK